MIGSCVPIPFGSATPRQHAEELPSWHRQEAAETASGGTATSTSTTSVAPLVAAELRRRIDVVDCTSMDANVNGMRHGDLEGMKGMHFFVGFFGLVKQQF